MIEPERCRTMVEVRQGVDETDRQLADLLGLRFRYMTAAARIKPDRGAVRDEARKTEVLRHAKTNALAADYPVELAEEIWERLVEASIAYEMDRFDLR
ncbi:chorismate mutase [Sphingomonas sp.]|uniref:chorismate mutase n=1 Tax=Sphingomonas sp. TaxID=28214 RepID=UPI0025E16F2D|nr:chorismate mutase [Sphingomonas sp.]